MMKLGSSFPVPAARDRVFAHFLDPDSMRACVPGCVELVKVDETHYEGRLVNEISHVRFSAGFTAEITELSAPAEVRALLRGEDRKLGSSIKVDATLAVRDESRRWRWLSSDWISPCGARSAGWASPSSGGGPKRCSDSSSPTSPGSAPRGRPGRITPW